MISKSTNNVRITEKKIMRFGDATNVHGRQIYRIYSRKYPKENLNSEDIFSDRKTQTRYTVEKWS